MQRSAKKNNPMKRPQKDVFLRYILKSGRYLPIKPADIPPDFVIYRNCDCDSYYRLFLVYSCSSMCDRPGLSHLCYRVIIGRTIVFGRHSFYADTVMMNRSDCFDSVHIIQQNQVCW